MENEQECFAYCFSSCKILKVKKCEGCGFYKTEEQFKNDRLKANDRIRSLDGDYMSYIMAKYYSGKR